MSASIEQHVTRQRPPWPPYPEAAYMLSSFECTCGWAGQTFRDVREPRWREVRVRAQEEAFQHQEAHHA